MKNHTKLFKFMILRTKLCMAQSLYVSFLIKQVNISGNMSKLNTQNYSILMENLRAFLIELDILLYLKAIFQTFIFINILKSKLMMMFDLQRKHTYNVVTPITSLFLIKIRTSITIKHFQKNFNINNRIDLSVHLKNVLFVTIGII